jgi:2-oxoglutarate ferredoxin oxidoreductase subunit beta
LSRLPGEDLRNTPIGVFRKVARDSYDRIVREQLDTARSTLAGGPEAELAALLGAGDTWTIL